MNTGMFGAYRLVVGILLLICHSIIGAEATVSSKQHVCVSSLVATAKTEAQYDYKVTKEFRENTKRLVAVELPEMQDTWINRWLTYPVIRTVGNGRLRTDNTSETLRSPDEFTFQTLSVSKISDDSVRVALAGQLFFEGDSTQFSVQTRASFETGNWEAFKAGKKVKIVFSPKGHCVLERALLGGDNHIIPLACDQALNYLGGKYGEAPPIELEYTSNKLVPSLTGNNSRLEFSGLGLVEQITIRLEDFNTLETKPANQNP